ncbi:MAG: DUF6056 family protein [Vicingaceae bacterium]|nr:DUF6056 family protein [Vicingaceae bacterium]
MEVVNKKSNLILLIVASILILPFIVISFFTNPSVDDYSFYEFSENLGYWGAQKFWYTSWTGRYFSSAILAAHPMWLKASFLYKIYPIIFIGLFLFSVYRMAKTFLRNNLSKMSLFLVSITLFLWCFNSMPSIVQGVYWLPGSVTYLLPLILLLFFGTNIFNILKLQFQPLLKHHLINLLLIMAICGSNETIMLILLLIMCFVLGYELIFNKTINKIILVYTLWTFVCFLIVYFAPGNEVRNRGFEDTERHQLLFTIINSFSSTVDYIKYWVKDFSTIISSTLLLLIFFKESKKEIKNLYKIGYIILSSFALIIISFFAAFWATGRTPPDRTLNVTFWVFIIFWTICLYYLALFIRKKINLKSSSLNMLVLVSSLLLFGSFFIQKNNVQLVVYDLFTGKAYQYNKDFQQREKILFNSNDTMPIVQALSTYPNSIFNEEFFLLNNHQNNKTIAYYYNKSGMQLNFSPPNYSDTYFFNLDDEDTEQLENLFTLTDNVFKSPPNSSLITSKSKYSVLFNIKAKDIKANDFFKVYVKSDIYSKEKVVDFAIVLTIEDKHGTQLYWNSEWINDVEYEINKWNKTDVFFPLTQKLVKDAYSYKVYVWNRGQNKVYVDDFVVSFF